MKKVNIGIASYCMNITIVIFIGLMKISVSL